MAAESGPQVPGGRKAFHGRREPAGDRYIFAVTDRIQLNKLTVVGTRAGGVAPPTILPNLLRDSRPTDCRPREASYKLLLAAVTTVNMYVRIHTHGPWVQHVS